MGPKGKTVLNIGKRIFVNNTLDVFNKLLQTPTEIFTDLFKDSVIYTIEASDLFYNINTDDVLLEICKNIPRSIYMRSSSDMENGYQLKYYKKFEQFNDLIFYHNTPILISVKCEQQPRGGRTEHRLYFHTIKKRECIDNLEKFIDVLCKRSIRSLKKERSKEITMLTDNSSADGYCYNSIKRRTFNDVFLPEYDKRLIIDMIDKYVNKRDWYIKNNIPNHFGILLYGSPGTGKSSIAQAIAEHVDAPLYVLNGDKLSALPTIINGRGCLTRDSLSPDSYRVLLVEDIDCAPLTKNRTSLEYESDNGVIKTLEKSGLASILNTFDGICAPNNIIYIFTTNHKEKIDPALIRPGRIDLSLEIKPVCIETLDQFCMFHYGKETPYGTCIREGVTFAELQVAVMRGLTMEELLETIKET